MEPSSTPVHAYTPPECPTRSMRRIDVTGRSSTREERCNVLRRRKEGTRLARFHCFASRQRSNACFSLTPSSLTHHPDTIIDIAFSMLPPIMHDP